MIYTCTSHKYTFGPEGVLYVILYEPYTLFGIPHRFLIRLLIETHSAHAGERIRFDLCSQYFILNTGHKISGRGNRHLPSVAFYFQMTNWVQKI